MNPQPKRPIQVIAAVEDELAVIGKDGQSMALILRRHRWYVLVVMPNQHQVKLNGEAVKPTSNRPKIKLIRDDDLISFDNVEFRLDLRH